MTFVYPLLLGGLLLAGLPVLLHFLVRKKPKVLTFPAFRFLMQKQRSNTRNLRLRHLFLLLLRIALIVLLCLALARPRLFHESMHLLSKERPVAMVLVFDTSPSMEYKVGEVTRLDLAKKRSLELLDQLPEDCRVMVLDASDPSTFGRAEFLPSLSKARERIQSLSTRPFSVPVTRAIDEAVGRFNAWEDVDGARLPRFICVFSDRTRPSWDSGATIRRSSDESMPVQILYFDVGVDDPVDLAVTQVEFARGRQSFAQGEKVELHAVVKATGKDKVENSMICQLGKDELKQAFSLDPGGQRTLSFVLDSTRLTPGYYAVDLRFETGSDALSFNNTRHVTFRIHPKPRVLVLADEPANAEHFALMLDVLNHDVALKSIKEPVKHHEYDAIFLVGVASPPESLWKTLTTHVNEGRGLAVIPPGDELDHRAYNLEAAQKLLGARIGSKVSATPGSRWNFAVNDLQHPFMQPFRDWLERGFFQRNPGRAEAYWNIIPADKDSVAVEYEDGKPAVVARQIDKAGRVLLLTTPMDDRKPEWNNYRERLTGFYVTLTMVSARFLIAEQASVNLNHIFGQKPPRVKQDLSLPKGTLTGGDINEEIRFDDAQHWVGDRLTRTGSYTITGSNPDRQESKVIAGFSINAPGEESDLSRVPVADIEAALGQGAVIAQDRRTSLPETIGGHWDEPMELFPWLMLGLLFLLALENLIANRFYRQEPEANANE